MNEDNKNNDGARNNSGIKIFSQPCQYFCDGVDNTLGAVDIIEATIEAFAAHHRDIAWYDKYLECGYRRIADIYYRNVCSDCDKCIPMRVVTSEFSLTNSQQKTYNKNSDIILSVKKAYHITNANIDLYKKYIVKHGGNVDDTLDNLHSIHLGYTHSIAMEYYLDDKLVAVSIVDETKDALSSVYCYYDYTLEKRRLGVYTLIKEIEYAKSLGKKYCYLGFYIKELNSMNYKASFIPNEVLTNDKWVLYNS